MLNVKMSVYAKIFFLILYTGKIKSHYYFLKSSTKRKKAVQNKFSAQFEQVAWLINNVLFVSVVSG